MRVRVKFFAMAREAAGTPEITIEVQEGITVRAFLQAISDRFGEAFRDFIFDLRTNKPKASLHFLVNGKDVDMLQGLDTRLEDGSVFAIIPPVGGGSGMEPPHSYTMHFAMDREADMGTVDSLESPKAPPRKVYVENYGCTANKDDSEIMLAYMAEKGYAATQEIVDADLILINTCGVKKQTEDKILERLRQLNGLGKPLIIAGCLTKIDPRGVRKAAPDFAAMLDPYSIEKMPEIIQLAERRERGKVYYSKGLVLKPRLQRVRAERLIEIVQVSQGCLSSCYFCATKIARGRLKSYPKGLIAEQVRRAVLRGAVEIQLTSQDLGPYGFDLGYTLAELLEDILRIEGDFRVRVGMMNPAFAVDIAPRLVDLFKDPRIYKFIHVPVQSGSDKVLREMNRDHTTLEFESIVDQFRGSVRDVTVATDIIVGYPTESDEDFEKTIRLIERIRPDITNISRFGPRPGTPAARLRTLPPGLVNERSRRLSQLCYSITLSNNRKMVGRRAEATILERNDDGRISGRTHNYKIVNVPNADRIGVILNVDVVAAYPRHLEAYLPAS